VVVNAGKNGRGRAEVNAANVISQDASIGELPLAGPNAMLKQTSVEPKLDCCG
jgi:hypothetical protein